MEKMKKDILVLRDNVYTTYEGRLGRIQSDGDLFWSGRIIEFPSPLLQMSGGFALLSAHPDKEVIAVKPRPELEPFFRLNYEEFVNQSIEGQVSTSVLSLR